MRAHLAAAEAAFEARDYWRAGAAATLARAYASASGTADGLAAGGSHPYLVDRDGYVWTWNGEVYTTPRRSPYGVGATRAQIEERYGPVTEVPR
jgi:hypothetical protein